jgi:hypothetical protein
MANLQPPGHVRPVHANAQRPAADVRMDFARNQRARVIASLLLCPDPPEPS